MLSIVTTTARYFLLLNMPWLYLPWLYLLWLYLLWLYLPWLYLLWLYLLWLYLLWLYLLWLYLLWQVRYFLFLNMSLMGKRQPITAAEWLYILLLLSPLLEEISQAQEQGLHTWWRSSRNRVDAVVLAGLVCGCVLRVLLARSVIYHLAGAEQLEFSPEQEERLLNACQMIVAVASVMQSLKLILALALTLARIPTLAQPQP